MASTQAKVAGKIDELMEKASRALVAREYFDCQRLCCDALGRAIAAADFERASRIVLPLQEARRQIRDLAFDTRAVHVLNTEPPKGREIRPGMYLICPPRVGVEGRLLREEAMAREIPVIVVVREPTTLDGRWPLVAVGPVTVRTKVDPPARRRPAKAAAEPAPTPEWFILANERLGDAAIASVPALAGGPTRVLALADRLAAVPDHEKLHQRFEEAAREAARAVKRRPRVPAAPIIHDNGDDE